MRIGYELIREQLFFRKELRERVSWFIKLRWAAIAFGLAGCWTTYLLGQTLPLLPLNLVFLGIAAYNGVFLLVARKLESFKPHEVGPFQVFAHAQITLDLLALYLVIYFTGGTASPLLIFVIFHIILAGILLSPLSCYLYGVLVIILLGVLVAVQELALLPRQGIVILGPPYPYGGGTLGAVILLMTMAGAVMVSAFLVTTLKVSLRSKGRELLSVSKELESTNAKLTALYSMVKEMGSRSELQELMDCATRQAARIMGVKACSIKLLDERRQSLRFASTYGLSEDYLSKGGVDIEKSPINKKIVEGHPYVIGRIDEKDYFQYPEDILKEGIASLLCLPLKAEKMILGVFCVYSDETYRFTEDDIEFFSLMTDLTAIAIERLSTEKTKSWFMMKAAHQLRSPLNALYSMLRLLGGGYLGPLDERQKEVLKRCELRVKGLGSLINDLLRVGQGRMDFARMEPHPVDAGAVLAPLMSAYQSQALEKGLEMAFEIQDSLPKVLADERLLDELVTNLVSNAIKYTPRGGKVRVALTAGERDWVRLEVSDTGIGISDQDLPRLFSEFFRGEDAKAFEEQGTGLGLVIVKEILDTLGGTIQVRSKKGQGTTFSCLLPAARPS
jgi:anti-sigma regulatory factor (Ser/Thr protein kinase)/uncharacterized protein YigA (DUF484 family)